MTSVSIVLPVYNEEGNLENLISDWSRKLSLNNVDFEFVVVEDGSTDNTKSIIKSLEEKFPLINLSQDKRRGYAKAVVDGIRNSNKDFILCTDSDDQIKVDTLIENLKNFPNENEFLIGYRNPRKDPWNRLLYSKMFKLFHDFLFNSKLKDPSCPFVIGKKNTYNLLSNNELLITREAFWWGFVAIAKKRGISFKQTSIKHFKREKGEAGYKLKDLFGIIIRNSKAMITIKNINTKTTN